jgi:hypothetical protein
MAWSSGYTKAIGDGNFSQTSMMSSASVDTQNRPLMDS